tara:strand:+ start:1575 stop:2441 length:867 start_codon:yes stop_codon:yes gene_type:complete
MKRKVIKQRDSYTITLPMGWVKEHGIDGSKEINVDEDKDGLYITTKESQRKEGEITIDSTNKKFIIYILHNAYRNGYDSLRIHVSESIVVEQIEGLMKNCMGWEIVKKKDKLVVIDNLTEPNTDRFEKLFRKSFYMIKEDLVNLQKGTLDLEGVSKHSQEVIKIDNFCRRAVTKKAVDKEKIALHWHFYATLTTIQRTIYYLLKAKKVKSVSGKIKELLGLLINAFDALHEGYFSKDLKKIGEVFDIIDKVYSSREQYLKADPILGYHLIEMARIINVSCSPCVGILV